MSALPIPALDAIAFQLLATLDQYEGGSERMVEHWPDLELYSAVSAQVEQLRLFSGALPDLRVQWVELLIAHAELVHFLWRVQYAPHVEHKEQLETVRERHASCVQALRQRCVRMVGRTGTSP